MTDFAARSKPIVFAACLAPAAYLLAGAFQWAGLSLGADPVKALLHSCGDLAIRFLLITLLMTPLRDLTHSIFWLRYRRMLGLFAFFYATLHLLVYVILDQSSDLRAVVQDILKRPYITIGMLAVLGLIPLAITSTGRMQRRLGRAWRRLHRLIYVIGILGVWHFWWGVKKDIREPLIYACLLAALLGYRLVKSARSSARAVHATRRT